MNKKDIAQIRRRFSFEKNNVTCVRGCYVNKNREIISEFEKTLTLMGEGEATKYLSAFKGALSGVPGKNLLDIAFTNAQVTDSAEHSLLSSLRASALKDDEPVAALFKKIIDSLSLDENYLVLLMHDAYDITAKAKDGESLDSYLDAQVFNYILCAVCPVKAAKPALSYRSDIKDFRCSDGDCTVGNTALGFMFPAFDSGRANIYNALYFTRDTSDEHEELIKAVFGEDAKIPASSEQQKDAFRSVLEGSLREECSYEVVQTVRDHIGEMIEEHDKDKSDDEPLVVTKNDVKSVLSDCGISEERQKAFDESFEKEFGVGADIPPHNLIETKTLEVHTPDVVVKVAPDKGELVETRVIDGVKYIMIRADTGAEVNGVNIVI